VCVCVGGGGANINKHNDDMSCTAPRISLGWVISFQIVCVCVMVYVCVWESVNSRVQQIWLFRKLRIQTLWWVQNWNLRHIYQISLLIFWAVFCAFGVKVFKKCYYDQKLSAKQVWRTWVKVKILHISVPFLLITCFVHFCYFFSGLEISVKFFVFRYPIWIFEDKFFFALINTFCKLWLQMRTKRLKKLKIFFMNVSLNLIRQPSKGSHNQVVKIVAP
jgi:hypothetical protein